MPSGLETSALLEATSNSLLQRLLSVTPDYLFGPDERSTSLSTLSWPINLHQPLLLTITVIIPFPFQTIHQTPQKGPNHLQEIRKNEMEFGQPRLIHLPNCESINILNNHIRASELLYNARNDLHAAFFIPRLQPHLVVYGQGRMTGQPLRYRGGGMSGLMKLSEVKWSESVEYSTHSERHRLKREGAHHTAVYLVHAIPRATAISPDPLEKNDNDNHTWKLWTSYVRTRNTWQTSNHSKVIHTTTSYNVILAIHPASTPHILDIYNAAQLLRVNSCSNETGRGHECLVGRGWHWPSETRICCLPNE